MKKLLIILYLLATTSIVYSQFQDRYWIFGRAQSNQGTNINFDFYPTGPPNLYNTANPPPPMTNPPTSITTTNGFEGWSVVTEPSTGNLLFYTDGQSVFDGTTNMDITPPGGLGASSSSSVPVAVCVVPTCPFNQYYIFSNPAGTISGQVADNGPITYRIYDSGSSSFTPSIPLPGAFGTTNVGEGMIIIPSKTDPFTFWLITRLLNPGVSGQGPNSDYVVYRIDGSGITQSGVYNFGIAVGDTDTRRGFSGPSSALMNIAIHNIQTSPTNYLVAFAVSRDNEVFTRRFNSDNGSFFGPTNSVADLTDHPQPGNARGDFMYDVEFSPSGQFLYYATYFPSEIYQYQIGQPTNSGIRIDSVGDFRGGGLKLGPDGFIYHIRNAGDFNFPATGSIGRVVQPDILTTGAGNLSTMYEQNVVRQSTVFAYNFPEFVNIPNWNASVAVDGDTLICPDDQTKLVASVATLGVTVDDYDWYHNSILIATSTTPFLNASLPGNYYVEVNLTSGCSITSTPVVVGSKGDCYCCEENENLITNGNFNRGNVGFSSNYNYISTPTPATPNAVMPTEYSIVNSVDANLICDQWQVTDHSTCSTSGSFMVVNGNNGQTASSLIWKTTSGISVQEDESYRFCANFKNLQQCCFDVVPEIEIRFSIPGFNTQVSLNSSNPLISCYWQRTEIDISIPSGTTSLDIEIWLDEQRLGDGNDFAIDDISLQKIPPIDKMYTLFGVTPKNAGGGNFALTANVTLQLPSQDCGFYWEVCELDNTNNCISSTLVSNPSQWWSNPMINNFAGYNGTSSLSGSNLGTFSYAKNYRIKRGVWCDCFSWNEFVIDVRPNFRRRRVSIFDSETGGLVQPTRRIQKKE